MERAAQVFNALPICECNMLYVMYLQFHRNDFRILDKLRKRIDFAKYRHSRRIERLWRKA